MVADGLMIEAPYLLSILMGAAGVIALLFKLLIASKDSMIASKEKDVADAIEQKKVYKEIAQEAIRSATETTNFYRAKEGKPPLVMSAPVVPEGSSPPTPAQRETANLATMRASMALIKLVVGQEPRKEPTGAADEPFAVASKMNPPPSDPPTEQTQTTGTAGAPGATAAVPAAAAVDKAKEVEAATAATAATVAAAVAAGVSAGVAAGMAEADKVSDPKLAEQLRLTAETSRKLAEATKDPVHVAAAEAAEKALAEHEAGKTSGDVIGVLRKE